MAPSNVKTAMKENAYEELMDPQRKWYNNRRLIILNAWIVLLLVTSTASGYDGSMVNGLQSLPQWESYFGFPTKGKLGLLGAIQNIGSLAGYPFAPYLCDGIGRRPTVFIGASMMVIATAIQTASQSVEMFIGARFLVGFGLTFAASASPMLVAELSYPKYRAPLTSVYNSLWHLGSIVAAWATFGSFKIQSTWAWRLPSALQAVPSLVQVFLVWFVPESPRFLIRKGEESKALRILAYYHADGDENDPLVRYEFEEIKAAMEFDRTVAANIGWRAFLASSSNLKRVRIIIAIAFFSQWSGNGLASYYLNKVLSDIGITNPTTQLLLNGILSIWSLLCALTASSTVEHFGRRILFITSGCLMTLCFTMQTVCFARFTISGDPNAAHGSLAVVWRSPPLIVTYALEILPYNIRAKGFNIFNITISIALIFNQYVNPIALGMSSSLYYIHTQTISTAALNWKYYVVYCVWLVCECVFLYFYLVETKNHTLEETAAIFDGESAREKIVDSAAALAGMGVMVQENKKLEVIIVTRTEMSLPTTIPTPPLAVSIVGAGIAGLTAAIAFRRNGHHVQIFESAEKKTEVGAALGVPLNAQLVLEYLGYSKDNLKSVDFNGIERFDALTGEGNTDSWLLPELKTKPNLMVLRNDLHAELERLALGPGEGPPAKLHLASKVIACSLEEGSLTLSDGRVITGDLILGADGVSSFMRTSILGHVVKTESSGWSCYRGLIEISKLEGVPGLEWLWEGISGGRSVTKQSKVPPFRMLFVYLCHGRQLLNFVGFFDDPYQDDTEWKGESTRDEVLEAFADFHPKFQPILTALNDRVLKWQLRKLPALPTWVRGRATLLGDAAHGTLPTLAQGAAMAIEDAGALGILFPAGTTSADVPARLNAYQELRKERDEFVGRESLEQAVLPAKVGEFIRSLSMQEYLMGYDTISDTRTFFAEKFGSNSLRSLL
ncbi:MFS domain-containing protein [Mycena sanguinolenta]|uniref:MFS domain-containing protein n=1 Tax=Mycena sanguinolenta TaxID=230812 RepID=A0A8H6YGV1_9AGAR|nr:MFS domain-containing protein [Mycena sanguinolenta]